MTSARDDRVGAFVDACITDVTKAKALAAADPTLLRAEWAGDPLLHWMAIEDFAAGVATLLDLGVPVDGRDETGQTALHHAVRLGRFGIVRMLLQRGADPNAFHAEFLENPVAIALQHASVDVAVLLIDAGARCDYLLPTHETVFSGMAKLAPVVRDHLVSMLAARGITRDGLFRTLGLDRIYDSPEQTYGW